MVLYTGECAGHPLGARRCHSRVAKNGSKWLTFSIAPLPATRNHECV